MAPELLPAAQHLFQGGMTKAWLTWDNPERSQVDQSNNHDLASLSRAQHL